MLAPRRELELTDAGPATSVCVLCSCQRPGPRRESLSLSTSCCGPSWSERDSNPQVQARPGYGRMPGPILAFAPVVKEPRNDESRVWFPSPASERGLESRSCLLTVRALPSRDRFRRGSRRAAWPTDSRGTRRALSRLDTATSASKTWLRVTALNAQMVNEAPRRKQEASLTFVVRLVAPRA